MIKPLHAALLVLSSIASCRGWLHDGVHVSLHPNLVVRRSVICVNQSANSVSLSNPHACDTRQAAHAEMKVAVNQTGWSYLEVSTDSKFDDITQAYSAGAAEAAVSHDLIAMHIKNTYYFDCVKPKKPLQAFCAKLRIFLKENWDFMLSQIESNPNDMYWKQVQLILYQLSGMENAFKMIRKSGDSIKPLKIELNSRAMLLFLQLGGDLMDLEQALGKPQHLWMRPTGYGACSVLIKPSKDLRDLYFAHDTWTSYQSMLRIAKLYNFNYHGVAAQRISLSGYPGTLPSIDDFYLTSAGLAITETTIGNSNAALWTHVKPDTVLTWIRSQVASRTATDARMWAQTFARHNSGTYNNQWMVVDYKQFTPGQSLSTQQHLFWVLEQIPGTIHMQDMTQYMAHQGYWPSYNVPFFPGIFNMSGCWENVKKYGDWFTYDKSPRAQIFKRDAQKVNSMKSLLKIMRYNDYKHDALSRCNCTPPYSGENAIAARSDLNPKNGTYPFASLGHRNHGATDMKATNSKMMKNLRFVGISGPTYDQQPVFKWSTTEFGPTTPHHGHPDEWRFPPVLIKWSHRVMPHRL